MVSRRRRRSRLQVALFAITLASFGLSSRAPAQALCAEWHGTPDGLLGIALANAGDVDGDGADDLLVGEPSHTGAVTKDGRVWVYSGRTSALIRMHDGTQVREGFGTSMTGMGDLDSDGFADYAVGADRHDTTIPDVGMVVVYSGSTGGVIWTAYGVATGDAIGKCIAALDDQDGDGRAELLAGMRNKDTARIFDGFGSLLHTLNGTSWTMFGYAVARAGDLDGDGKREFLIGSPGWSAVGKTSCGRVDVYSGSTFGALTPFVGDAGGDFLGVAVAGIDDVDGDGIGDLCGGADDSNTAGADAGYLRVVSGSTQATLRTEYGTAGDLFGWAVTDVGDLDHDGIGDYAASGILGGAAGRGEVRVYSGQFGSLLWKVEGANGSSGKNVELGSSLAGGDWNGDGIGDLAIGDRYFTDSTGLIGGAWAWLGCPAWWENYSAGWPGKNGVPGLVALDDPGVGESIDVQLDNSLGASTFALLLLGFAEANIPTNKDGALLLSPFLTMPLSLPANGLVLTDTLPDDSALYFLDVYLQALEVDPFATKEVSFTAGLRLRCGFDL